MYTFISFQVDGINTDAPFLLELHGLKEEGLLFSYLSDKVAQRVYRHSKPVTYKNGHFSNL